MRVADYAGRAVIVTGGTRGIGAGIARAFLEAGAQVLVCGRTEPPDAASLPGAGGRMAVFARADVRDPVQARRLIGEAARPLRAGGRGGQQRGWVPGRGGGYRVPPAARQGHRAEPDRAAARRPGRQRGDAGPARGRLDHHDRQRERHPALAGDRRVRRGQGGPAPPGHQPRGRVGAQGPGEQRRPGAGGDRGRRRGALPGFRRAGGGRGDGAAGPPGHPGDVADACLFLASPLAASISGASLLLHGGGERPAYLGGDS